MQNKKIEDPKAKTLEEQGVEIKSVVKVNKGGRQRRFSATVVVGDRHGQVGLGMGKANEVPDAIKKAIQDANKNLIRVPLTDNRTIAYEVIGHIGAAKVLLKPAPEGTGIIAGGPVRAILELAGIRNVYSKVYGSRAPINIIRATQAGLASLKSYAQVQALRAKVEEQE